MYSNLFDLFTIYVTEKFLNYLERVQKYYFFTVGRQTRPWPTKQKKRNTSVHKTKHGKLKLQYHKPMNPRVCLSCTKGK